MILNTPDVVNKIISKTILGSNGSWLDCQGDKCNLTVLI